MPVLTPTEAPRSTFCGRSNKNSVVTKLKNLVDPKRVQSDGGTTNKVNSRVNGGARCLVLDLKIGSSLVGTRVTNLVACQTILRPEKFK
jgi:hypothetical protein